MNLEPISFLPRAQRPGLASPYLLLLSPASPPHFPAPWASGLRSPARPSILPVSLSPCWTSSSAECVLHGCRASCRICRCFAISCAAGEDRELPKRCFGRAAAEESLAVAFSVQLGGIPGVLRCRRALRCSVLTRPLPPRSRSFSSSPSPSPTPSPHRPSARTKGEPAPPPGKAG